MGLIAVLLRPISYQFLALFPKYAEEFAYLFIVCPVRKSPITIIPHFT